jgi:CcmD family protein
MKNFESIFAAYIVAWGIFFAYTLSLGSRLRKLRAEVERLKQLMK